LGEGLTTRHGKNKLSTKCYRGPWNWTDSLERHRQMKIDLRFGMWDVWKFLQVRFSGNSSKLIGKV